jgi:hypothetical protein
VLEKKKTNTKRISATVGEDLYQWICEESEKSGLAIASTVTVLLNKMRESQKNAVASALMLDILKDFTSEMSEIKEIIEEKAKGQVTTLLE